MQYYFRNNDVNGGQNLGKISLSWWLTRNVPPNAALRLS